MTRHTRNRLSWESVKQLVTLLVGAIGPIANLIDAISRIRLQAPA